MLVQRFHDASQEVLDLIAASTFTTSVFRGFLIFETRSVEINALAYTVADAEPAETSKVLVFDVLTTTRSPPLERRLEADYDGSCGVVAAATSTPLALGATIHELAVRMAPIVVTLQLEMGGRAVLRPGRPPGAALG